MRCCYKIRNLRLYSVYLSETLLRKHYLNLKTLNSIELDEGKVVYNFSVNNSLVMAKDELEIINDLDTDTIKTMVNVLVDFCMRNKKVEE